MKIVLSWLRDYIDWSGTAEDLSSVLTTMGIEVESIYHTRSNLGGCITAKILDVEPLPKSDHLKVCTVYDGEEKRSIVCGDPNVAPGQIVVLALPGTVLPTGIYVEQRSIGGVVSNGMLCSQYELEWSGDNSGIWVLEKNMPVGKPLEEILPHDSVLEVSVTPNRADVLSHFGIARVIAAATGLSAKLPPLQMISSHEVPITVEISKPELCHRYMTRVFEDVSIIPSPKWLQRRLELAGIRPHNVVVDTTNYVMLECGHPLHAFDYDTIDGNIIVVRTARDGECIITLDGTERSLTPSMLCICDARHPIAIAGIIGGIESAITQSTTRVLLESAYFSPSSIRTTAKTHGLQTESSYRFERGVDIEMLPYALDRAATMIAMLTGATFTTALDNFPLSSVHQPRSLQLRVERAQRIVGQHFDTEQVCKRLEQWGYKIYGCVDKTLTVQIPSFRTDVREEIDLLEDLAIASDYSSIEPSPSICLSLSSDTIPVHLRAPEGKVHIRHTLANLGFHEALHYNLCDPDTAVFPHTTVTLLNPLGRERSMLRQWLAVSMIESLSRNCRYGIESAQLFEIGKIFTSTIVDDRELIIEREHLAIGCSGLAQRRNWLSSQREFDIYDVKGIVETLLDLMGVACEWDTLILNDNRSKWFRMPMISMHYQGNMIGFIGQINRAVAQRYDLFDATFIAEINTDILYVSQSTIKHYQPPSQYPTVVRDVSLVIPKHITVGNIIDSLQHGGGSLIQWIEPFDVFEHESIGPEHKSIALSITFASKERTLTDDEVNRSLEAALEYAAQECGARLRT